MSKRAAFFGRRVALALVTLALACPMAGCDAASARQPHAPGSAPRPPRLSLVAAIGAVGAFYGRCDPAAHIWTLEFRDSTGADDLVYARVGTGRVRRYDVRPGARLIWHLVAGAARSHEPADPISRNPATTIPTTRRLSIGLSQGIEPHIYRVDATVALAAAIGDTTDCALVASAFKTLTYFNGGAPPIP